jgi:hypothetical protein
MPCHNVDTGRGLRSCELSRASEDEPSVGISCDKFHTRMVFHPNEFSCELSSLTLRNTPCRRRRSYVLLHCFRNIHFLLPERRGLPPRHHKCPPKAPVWSLNHFGVPIVQRSLVTCPPWSHMSRDFTPMKQNITATSAARRIPQSQT